MAGDPKRSAGNQKRNNHEVSKCLLAAWVDESGRSPGHHHFDIQTQEYRFEVGRRAKFASAEYLYMPLVDDGERSQALEDWLSVDESGLGLLCKAAAKGNPDLIPNDSRVIERAIRACVSLGMRSAYQFYMMSQIPGFTVSMGVETAHQAMAKNAFLGINSRYSKFRNWDFHIFYDLSFPLLVNEQPFRDWSVREDLEPHISMPIAPTALLNGSPPKDHERRFPTIAWYSAPNRPSVSEMHNDFILKTARQWVVGNSAEHVKRVMPQLSTTLVRERMSLDRLVIL